MSASVTLFLHLFVRNICPRVCQGSCAIQMSTVIIIIINSRWGSQKVLFYLYINKETTFNREGEVNKDRGRRREEGSGGTEMCQIGWRWTVSVASPYVSFCSGIRVVQFSSVQKRIYALGKAYMRSTPCLRSCPNTAFEADQMFVWWTMTLSRPFKEDHCERFLFPCPSPPCNLWCDVLGFVSACRTSELLSAH